MHSLVYVCINLSDDLPGADYCKVLCDEDLQLKIINIVDEIIDPYCCSSNVVSEWITCEACDGVGCIECDNLGKIENSYNPNGKTDYWCIGGRYDGYIAKLAEVKKIGFFLIILF